MRRLVPVVEVEGRRELGVPELVRLEFVGDRVRRLLAEGAVAVAVQVRNKRLGCWEGDFLKAA